MQEVCNIDLPPILLTSSVFVSAPFTKLVNTDDRLQLTIKSIKMWLVVSHKIKIVICDGSGYDFNDIVSRDFPNACIECLSFENDRHLVSIYGKGYGEGEIIKYAIEHSLILKEEKSFAKCTAKLWLNNYFDYLKKWNGYLLCDCNFINLKDLRNIRIDSVDTRFYIVDKEFYIDALMNAYKNVRDGDGYYLEHAYMDAVLDKKIKNFISTVPLNMSGVSGSSGLGGEVMFLQKIKKYIKIYFIKMMPKYKELFV
jgi:hypothetical protein